MEGAVETHRGLSVAERAFAEAAAERGFEPADELEREVAVTLLAMVHDPRIGLHEKHCRRFGARLADYLLASRARRAPASGPAGGSAPLR